MKSHLRATLVMVGLSLVAGMAGAPAALAAVATFGPYSYVYPYPSGSVKSSVPSIKFTTDFNQWYSDVLATVNLCDDSADGYRARAKVTYYDASGAQWGATDIVDATRGKGTCVTWNVLESSDEGWPAKAKLSVGRYDGDTGAQGYIAYIITLPIN
jgi:hypothetical protein